MTLRTRLLLIVGTTALALVLVIVLSALIGNRETRELAAIEGRLLPKLALGPRLDADFDRLGRNIRDAVAAQDLAALAETQALVDRMFERIDAAPGAIKPAEVSSVRRAVSEYHWAAQDVSRRLIAQETGEDILEAMASMQIKQRTAAETLKTATNVHYRQLTEHFASIEAARRTAARLRIAVGALCLALVLVLSTKLSRSVLGVIKSLSLGFQRFGSGDLDQVIPITTHDELGELASEANQMAARLRATLDSLADTSAALEHTNSELQAFSYSVAHDLRAPLRAMNGFAQMLIDNYQSKLDADGQDWLGEILGNAVKMAGLIDALLSLSRVTRAGLRVETVDLSALAREAGRQLLAADPSRVVELVVQPGMEAKADLQLARAVLENLLANAWKFSSKVSAARIEVGSTRVEGALAFFVRDNGAGFDMAFASKLFAPFQRLHTATEYPGTGIGLATVKRIINRHGGRAWAEGQVDVGATFYFTFPARPAVMGLLTDSRPVSAQP